MGNTFRMACRAAVLAGCLSPAGAELVAFQTFDPDAWTTSLTADHAHLYFSSSNIDLKNGWGFTSQASGELVELAAQVGTYRRQTFGSATMELYRDNGAGRPGELLGRWTETVGDGTNQSFFLASDTSGVFLNEGETYYLVLVRPANTDPEPLVWRIADYDLTLPQISTIDGSNWDRTEAYGYAFGMGMSLIVTPTPGTLPPLGGMLGLAAIRRRHD